MGSFHVRRANNGNDLNVPNAHSWYGQGNFFSVLCRLRGAGGGFRAPGALPSEAAVMTAWGAG